MSFTSTGSAGMHGSFLDHMEGFSSMCIEKDYEELFAELELDYSEENDVAPVARDVNKHMDMQFSSLRRQMRALSGALKRSFMQQAHNSHAAAEAVRQALQQSGVNPSAQEIKSILKVCNLLMGCLTGANGLLGAGPSCYGPTVYIQITNTQGLLGVAPEVLPYPVCLRQHL